MGRATSNILWPRPPAGPVEGSKRQISFNFNSNIYITNVACVLTNERYKTYRTAFLFCHLGHAPGVGLWGVGVPRGKKIKYGHVAYQNDGDDGQYRMQVEFKS